MCSTLTSPCNPGLAENLRFSTSRTGVSKTEENKVYRQTLQAWFTWLNHDTKASGGQPALHTVGLPRVPTFPQPFAPSQAAQHFGLKNNSHSRRQKHHQSWAKTTSLPTKKTLLQKRLQLFSQGGGKQRREKKQIKGTWKNTESIQKSLTSSQIWTTLQNQATS